MGINQLIKPMTTLRNNTLYVGGCDLTKLAEQYGTPLYVIDEATLRGLCREYKDAFKNYPNIRMTYACKALCNAAILAIVASEGFGFDTVSEGEIYTVMKSGADLSKVTFNGNNKTGTEIRQAIRWGVGLFSADNYNELEILNRIAFEEGSEVNVLIRITPGIECHTHEYIKTGQIDSKFGFDMSQVDDVVRLILSDYKNIKLKGIHAHIGSQIFELESFQDEIDLLIKELKRINDKFSLNLNEINIGGGLGVKYTDEDVPPSIADFGQILITSLENACKKYSTELPTIYIEPGRSIISPAGVTLYTVGSIKHIPNMRKYVAVDGGMADNPRPSMYGAKYYAEIANNTDNVSLEKVTVAGRYCESGDIIIEDIELPVLSGGEILCVYNTGAYNYSMASNYNRVKKLPMVLVNNSQSDIIVDGESLEDLVRLDRIPDRLKLK